MCLTSPIQKKKRKEKIINIMSTFFSQIRSPFSPRIFFKISYIIQTNMWFYILQKQCKQKPCNSNRYVLHHCQLPNRHKATLPMHNVTYHRTSTCSNLAEWILGRRSHMRYEMLTNNTVRHLTMLPWCLNCEL